MILYAPAKINIGLQILRKRDDGYHDISSLIYPVPLRDILEVKFAAKQDDEFSLTQSGILIPGKPESNLIWKAWNLFCKRAQPVNIRVHIHKVIPAGAGLGGGSSDGAAVLNGLNTLIGHALSTSELRDLAAELGSDCPVFIENSPSIAEGRGELLRASPVDLKGYYLMLLNPSIHLETALAYKNSSPYDKREELSRMLVRPVSQWKNLIENDFEKSIFIKYPEIAGLKSALFKLGALYASMSGSGSSVYGIFKDKPDPDPDIIRYIIWQGRL